MAEHEEARFNPWAYEPSKVEHDNESDPRDLRILRAAHHGWEDLARRLLDDTNQQPFDINSARRDGHTALSLAAKYGHEGMVRLLLSHGAEVGSRSENPGGFFPSFGERTPLFFAANHNHPGVVRILIEAGANMDGGTERGGHHHPVSQAARRGQVELVRVFLEYGAPAEFREEYGKPSLCFVAEDGLDEMVELLLEFGADVNLPDYGGMAPLSWAAQNGHLRTVKILLAHGADIMAIDNEHACTPWVISRGGQTALTKAAYKGQSEVVRSLLERGADSNFFDFSNKCPLVYAARGGHFATVRALLEHDPKPTVVGPEGLTTLEVAIREFKKLEPPEWYEDMWELLEPKSTRAPPPGVFETLFGVKLW